MLDAQGHLMLTDFGLSKVAIDALTVCGTVEFMAPEILEERSKYDKSVDYWSLGIMIYDMITGAPPFTGSNRKKIMEAVLKKKPFFPKYMTSASRDICTKVLLYLLVT
jgi:p70 ribosomal S6 kinase